MIIIKYNFFLVGHLIDVLSRDEDIGAGDVPADGAAGLEGGGGGGVRGGRGGKGGEHSVKRFMNVKVKSSKEEVKVYAKNELVSEMVKFEILVIGCACIRRN